MPQLMEAQPFVWALLLPAGAALGFFLGWLMAQIRFNRTAVSLASEKAALGESLRIRSQENAMLRERLEQNEVEKTGLLDALSELKKNLAACKTAYAKEKIHATEKVELLQDVRAGLTDTYRATAASALKENNQAFLDLAQTTFARYFDAARTDLDARGQAVREIVKPLKEALDRYDHRVHDMERAREKAYGGLREQVNALLETQDRLRKETLNLAKALRVPHVRGRWGEITLRRVAELAGMQPHCDFFEQTSAHGDSGTLRPDMMVRLPGGRRIVVDAKVPLSAYLEALEAADGPRKDHFLSQHAQQVWRHIQKLGQKAYWTQFTPSPDFVVLFIPGENFFAAALQKDPGLIENGVKRGVVLATPTTLITLLKTVAFGWQEAKMTENARRISLLGKELFDRLLTMSRHINNLGRDIERSVNTYNQVVGSLDRRVLASARKFKSLGVSRTDDDELAVSPVEARPRKTDQETAE